MAGSHKVNGKKLNGFYSDSVHAREHIFKPKDRTGNRLNLGDRILHIAGSRGLTYSIKTIIQLTEDTTGESFLGIKLDNGQYSTLYWLDCFLVDDQFCQIHSKLISKSHL